MFRILFIVDAPGWAHDRKTRALQRALADEFLVEYRYTSDVTEADLDRADLLVVYYWLHLQILGHVAGAIERNGHKLLMGICNPTEMDGTLGEGGRSVLERLPRAIFVNNQMLFDEFRGQFGRPVYLTPNGVDTSFFRPRPRSPHPGRLVVGWAGSLTNHGPEVRGYDQVIVPAVTALSGVTLSSAVREERWRSPEEMLEFYDGIDVYACASRCEGTPNPCLEAAACGIPLITTRVGNMPELVVDGVNGYFIERQPEELESRLRVLRDDPSLRSSMGAAMLRSIQAWDWSVQAEHFRKMFREQIRSLRGPAGGIA